MTVLLFSLAFPLHCVWRAVIVGGFALLEGGLLGLALAGITRTRRVWLIYVFLGAACLLLIPVWLGWPPGESEAVHLWRGAPDILNNYLDFLRYGLFLLGLPYPFAHWGHHAPDASAIPLETPENTPESPLSPSETSHQA